MNITKLQLELDAISISKLEVLHKLQNLKAQGATLDHEYEQLKAKKEEAAIRYQTEKSKAQRLKQAAEQHVQLTDAIKQLFETV